MKYIVLIKYSKPICCQEKNFYTFHTLEEAEQVASNIKNMHPKALIYVRELTKDVEF